MTSLAPVETSPATATSGIIRVMVVDDSAVVRGLVSRWVDEDPGMETVGRFSNGQLALAGIVGAAPDVVILDIEMLVMDGMTAPPSSLWGLHSLKASHFIIDPRHKIKGAPREAPFVCSYPVRNYGRCAHQASI